MRARWVAIRESFWLLPSAVVAGLGLLGLALLRLDRHFRFDGGLDIVFGGDASAARDILAAIAGSLVTVSGVTLSLTIVTFQLVAGQYSPRAVRSLVRDRMIQLTAGVFVGVVAYCLLALRVVRGADSGAGEFVPRLTVTAAIALALGALALLIVFVHHLASRIRVENIVADVARETLSALGRLYPERLGDPLKELEVTGRGAGEIARSSRPGFVQSVSADELARALPPGSRLELHVAAGDFVTERVPLATLWPPPSDPERFRRDVQACVPVASERTVEQDAAFGMRQLTDIALRALSPSLNDPTTAITCIGYLRACLERLATQALPARVRHVGDVTLLVRRRSFAEYVEPLVELSRYASGDARVAIALLDAIAAAARAAGEVGAADRIETLRRVTLAIATPALVEAKTDHDRSLLERAQAPLQQQV